MFGKMCGVPAACQLLGGVPSRTFLCPCEVSYKYASCVGDEPFLTDLANNQVMKPRVSFYVIMGQFFSTVL